MMKIKKEKNQVVRQIRSSLAISRQMPIDLVPKVFAYPGFGEDA